MKFYLKMPKKLMPFYLQELNAYSDKMQAGNLQQAWLHLERAHILGQRYPITHNKVHFKMLQFGIKIKSKKEILGQIPRLFFGGIKSFVGSVPIGNPGGSNVPPLKSFLISNDLQIIFNEVGINYFKILSINKLK
jgi:Protein of unknown function (DUF3703)